MNETIYLLMLLVALSISYPIIKAGCERNGFSKASCVAMLAMSTLTWIGIGYANSASPR